jgi:hypothetical protein
MLGVRLVLAGLFAGVALADAAAQFELDVENDRVRRAAGDTYIEDLAVNDTALVYAGSLCVSGSKLHLPGWSEPRNLAEDSYAATGTILRVTILPGRRVRAVCVDAAQAQSIAKGNTSAPAVLSKLDFNKDVRRDIAQFYVGGGFFIDTCERLESENPMRALTLYPVDTSTALPAFPIS